jgi:membrane fusion protein, multidrug efflux system
MSTMVRRIGVVSGFAILLGSFAFSTYLKKMKQPPPQIPSFENKLKVPVRSVNLGERVIPVEIQGSLVAYNRIELFSEVSGVLKQGKIPFKVGSSFEKGMILVDMDDREAQLSLYAQKSTFLNTLIQMLPDIKMDYISSYADWKQYADEFDVTAELKPLPLPKSDKERYFLVSRNIDTQYFNIKSAEERIQKFKIAAPFSGVITQTSLQTGGLVRVGQKLGEIMDHLSYELEAALPLAELKFIKPGDDVELISTDVEGKWNGKVARIAEQVNPTTQTVLVFIQVKGKGLKEGMYLKGTIKTRSVRDVIQFDRNLVINGREVFVVKDSMLIRKEIQPIIFFKDQVVATGLEEGEWLVSGQVAGASAGLKVIPVIENTSK